MSDTFTEVSHEGWFSRLGNSIKGVVVGIILFLLGFPLLFWNEGRAVTTYRSLNEGQGAVVTVDSAKVDSANENKLIHTHGKVTTTGELSDGKFGVKIPGAIRLKRMVEMYQWEEDVKTKSEKKVGGGRKTTKTYSYNKVWSEKAINSSNFKKSGYNNPSMREEGRTWNASNVKLGGFDLGSDLTSRLSAWKSVDISGENFKMLQGSLKGQLKLHQGGYYWGNNPSDPQIGDLKITFKVIESHDVTVIGQQIGSTFTGYQTDAGDKLLMLSTGVKTSKEMFDAAQAANTMMTWILRFVGFFMMFIGIRMLFEPFVTFADVIPFLGDILGTGVSLFAFVIAAFCAFCTIAFAWFFVRPVLSIFLLLLAGGAVYAGKQMAGGGGGGAAAAGGGDAPAAAPPPMPEEGGGEGPPPMPE